MTPEIKEALDEMQHCAFCAFYAVERFGKDSPQHAIQKTNYFAARNHYEALCTAAGREPYATYDAD